MVPFSVCTVCLCSFMIQSQYYTALAHSPAYFWLVKALEYFCVSLYVSGSVCEIYISFTVEFLCLGQSRRPAENPGVHPTDAVTVTRAHTVGGACAE